MSSRGRDARHAARVPLPQQPHLRPPVPELALCRDDDGVLVARERGLLDVRVELIAPPAERIRAPRRLSTRQGPASLKGACPVLSRAVCLT